MQPTMKFHDGMRSPGNGIVLGYIRDFKPSDVTIRTKKTGHHRHTAEVVTPSPSIYMPYIHYTVESRTEDQSIDFCIQFCQSQGFNGYDIAVQPYA